MWTEQYPLGDGTIAIVFFMPKLINQEDLINRIEFRGSNDEILDKRDWSAMPRTRKEARDELNIPL